MPKHTLMQHQQDGVKFLDSVDGIGALLWDPGVGKTFATLAWIDSLTQRHKEVRVLVVAPLTAADTWVLQPPGIMDSVVKARLLRGSTKSILAQMPLARDWTTVPDAAIQTNHPGVRKTQVSGNRVTIISLSSGSVSSWCTNKAKTTEMLRAVRQYAPHVIVVDESHIIKSAQANISKAMYQIGMLAPHRIILTGTVNPHSPLDVYGQWRFLAPWTFSDDHGESHTMHPLSLNRSQLARIRPWSWDRFRLRYSIPGGFEGRGIGGFQNLPELNARVAERSMVVRKEDALDLPPTTDIDTHVTLSPRESKAYAQMRDDLAAQMEDGSLLEAPNALAKIMKLRQITAGFARDTETEQVHVIGTSKQKAVKEIVNETLAGESRVVVFAYFRAECEALSVLLRKSGQRVEVITGATPATERLAIRKRFADVSGNEDPKNAKRLILVAQARTMSVSVNELVTAQHAVFASMSERRDDWVQARGRLDRNGQTKPVTFWNVYCPGTVDEIMLDRHKDRGNLEKALLDHIKTARKDKK